MGIGRCEFEYLQFLKTAPALAKRTKNGLLTSLQQQLVKTGRYVIRSARYYRRHYNAMSRRPR